MSYPAIAIANFFIEAAKKSGGVTPMKLQKLIYYAHGWHLALTGKPLIKERVEAWKYGPVIPSIYHEFKNQGEEPVTEPAVDFDWVNGNLGDLLDTEMTTPRVPPDSDAIPLLNRIWEVYGKKYSGVQLSNATHVAGTPWYITWEERGGKDRQGTDISEDLIKNHFDAMKVKG